uniref:Uncharacterized protein n=1 Tax=Siphoviridae sp. ctGN02 TaxID=2825411 RepID=A0A8S5PI48_9CAUD|nr:MAG TPA: hypothetical protein [Siphoviridae sp. ctGN02]
MVVSYRRYPHTQNLAMESVGIFLFKFNKKR